MNNITEKIYKKFLQACEELNVKPTEARWKKYFKAYKEHLKNNLAKC